VSRATRSISSALFTGNSLGRSRGFVNDPS
jgi:hypothetical protein